MLGVSAMKIKRKSNLSFCSKRFFAALRMTVFDKCLILTKTSRNRHSTFFVVYLRCYKYCVFISGYIDYI
jgi:hypothetical protein